MRTRGGDPNKPSNVASISQFGHGDVDKGFEEADFIIEESYKTEQTHQGYIEPHACTATVNEGGQTTVWCATQGHFAARAQTASILRMDLSDLKFVATEIGGGFGGKTVVYLEPVAVMLSKMSGRPVKMVMSREEVFRATGPAAGTHCRVKVGATRDGTITAANSSSISDGASALLIAAEDHLAGAEPLARIAGHATFSRHPSEFTLAPIGAIEKLLQQLHWSIDQVDLFEINEAFAMVTMLCINELGLDHERVNVFGGACAQGHPIGSTGSRLIVTLAHAMRARGLARGIAALCIGGGEATAIALARD